MAVETELLKKYFNGQRVSPIKGEAEQMYVRLKVHADGEYPKKLIEERRPSESDTIMKYREKIFVEITKETFSSIVNALQVIRRSSDWSIRYDAKSISSKIAKDETLEQYCEYQFPMGYHSVTNWVFGELLKEYLIDANAVMMLLPINMMAKANEYLKPFPRIFNSCDVIDYIPGQLAIFSEQPEMDYVPTESGLSPYESKIFYVVDSISVQKWKQVQTGEYQLVSEYFHNLGYMPCIKMKGVFKKRLNTVPIYESRIQSIAPRLDEVVREYSDLQAEVVQHVHSEKWQYATQNCIACADANGKPSGIVKSGTTKKVCSACKGSGKVASSPYTTIVVDPNVNKIMGEDRLTMPPGGYLLKPVEIVKIQDARIDAHVYKALASLNMQFLAKTPLSESGIAKEVDRDALNTFVYSIAEDIVWMMDNIYSIINDYRYMKLVPVVKERKAMLPKITVPEKFDLLSSGYLMEEISKAKTSNISPIITNAMELEYTNKKFYAMPEIRDELQCVQQLDPIPSATDDEKMLRLQNGGVTTADYVISCNIQPFVRRAVIADNNFYSLPYEDKMKVMNTYADEKMKMNSVKVNIEEDINGGGNMLSDDIGKLPLALQQLALARERAITANDMKLANELGRKMKELIGIIEV